MSNGEQFAEKFAERWRERDPDRFVDLFHEDGTLLHPGMGRPIGRDQVPGYMRRVFSIVPDGRLDPKAWAANDDTVFIAWSMSASFRGQQEQREGADRFTLKGDRAIYGVAYFATLPLWAAIDPSMKRGDMLPAAARVAALPAAHGQR